VDGTLLDILRQKQQGQPNEEAIGFCNLVGLMPFHPDEDEDSDAQDGGPNESAYEAALAVVLAAQHLNSGDGSLIDNVGGLSDRCNIRFTTSFVDTKYNPGLAIRKVINITSDGFGGDDGTDKAEGRDPSVFIGAFVSDVSVPTSIVTSLQGYPQISGASTSELLNDKDRFPLFARTIPSDDAIASAAIRFFRHELGLKYLAVININDSYGNEYVSSLRAAANDFAPDLSILQIPIDEQDIEQAIAVLKDSQYQVVFAILISKQFHDDILTEAVRQGVAGNGEHNWFFTETFRSVLDGRIVEVGSPLHKAYNGVGMFSIGPVMDEKAKTFNSKMVALKNKEDEIFLNPLIPGLNQTRYLDREEFLDPIKYEYTYFFYEAAILSGLSACRAVEGETLLLTGENLFQTLVNYNIEGSLTGDLQLDNITGSRLPDSTFFLLTNFVKKEFTDPETGSSLVRFETRATNTYHHGNWTESLLFQFNDGTTDIPTGIPDPGTNSNFINTSVRVITYSLFGVASLLSIAFAVWTWRKRKSRIVRASQPFFLYLLCVGCALLTCAIIPLGIDHSISSMSGCAVACNSVVWLVSLGTAIVLSSLFSKTHRINKIMNNSKKFKRVTVTIHDTLKPAIALLLANILILSIMTALNPIGYDIHVVSRDEFGQPIESFGHCEWGGSMGFLIPLASLQLVVLFAAIIEAWKSRNLSTEFAESKNIFQALIATLLVVFIGVPVLVIANDDPDASAFVSSGIVFVASASILFLIFVPKIKYEKNRILRQSQMGNVHISGLDSAGNGIGGHLSASSTGSAPEEGGGCIDEGEDENEVGERILTTKTTQELAIENARLRRVLARMRKQDEARMSETIEPSEVQPLNTNGNQFAKERKDNGISMPLQTEKARSFSGTKDGSDIKYDVDIETNGTRTPTVAS